MRGSFSRNAASSALLITLATAAGYLSATLPTRELPYAAARAIRALRSNDLNLEARETQVAGYYEGLLSTGSRASGVNSLLTGQLRQRSGDGEDFEWVGSRHDTGQKYVKVDGLLLYEPKAGVDLKEVKGAGVAFATNSSGLHDQEYPLERRPRTRRIALLGDSVTRGYGTRPGTCFEALLEERFNADRLGGGGGSGEAARVEILNFAVGGYRMTQISEVARRKAPRFKPDVYAVALTEQTSSRRWGAHLAQAYHEGVDLEHDFLKELAAEAGLRPEDSTTTLVSKLSRFRLPTMRWVLGEIQGLAAREGAAMVVLLIPTVREREALEESFAGVRELLAELGIPYADVLEVFDQVEDPRAFQVKDWDIHPNEAGHRLIYEALHRKIAASPELNALFLGSGG